MGAAVAMRLLGWLVVAGFRMSAFQGLVQLQNFLTISTLPPIRPHFVIFPPSVEWYRMDSRKCLQKSAIPVEAGLF